MDNIVLRRLNADDAYECSRQMSSPAVLRYLSDDMAKRTDEKHTGEYIDLVIHDFPFVCAIQVESGFCGIITLNRQSGIFKNTMELGYWLGEEHWNKGVTTEAIRQMLKLAFNHAGAFRVFARIISGNAASCKVLEKNGFVREAVMADAGVKAGQPVDVDLFAITRRDYLRAHPPNAR